MHIRKKIISSALVTIIAVSITGCGVKTDTPVIGKVMGLNNDQVLKVGDSICTVEEAELVLMNLQNQYKKDFGGNVSWNQKMGDTTIEKFIFNKVKSDLSIVYAMSSIAAEKEITLTEEEKSLVNTAAKEYYDALNESEKKYTGATLEHVQSLYSNYYLADKVYNQETEGIRDTVSDEEARVMKIQYIFIDTEKTSPDQAQETLTKIKKQVESGAQDFLVQANKYSDNKTVEKNLKKNEASLDYEKNAFELAEGKVSDIFTESDGLYLVKCVNSYLEAESLKNKEQIIRDNKTEVFNKTYSSYIEKSSSDINSKAWDKLKLSTDENVNASNLFEVYDKYFNNTEG